jgi:hypothetical protein
MLTDKCFWCRGEKVVCILCDQEIPCMFCGGSGECTPEKKFPAHQCGKEEQKWTI